MPVVTTPIGAEGLLPLSEEEHHTTAEAEDGGAWGGLWTPTDAGSFASASVRLYTDEALWQRCVSRGTALYGKLFDEPSNLRALRIAIETALSELKDRRASDHVMAMLWHHRHRSTRYFSAWIEAKERLEKERK